MIGLAPDPPHRNLPPEMHVIVRTDGSHSIGMGHLMRSATLAAEFDERGHRVRIVTTTPVQATDVAPDGVEVVSITDRFDTGWLDATIPDVVLMDLPEIGDDHQETIRESVPMLVTVRDDPREIVCADVVVDYNIYADAAAYEWVEPEPTWCLGLKFALLRPEYVELSRRPAPWRKSPRHALVTMGGVDKANHTPTAMEAFRGTELEVTVVIGPEFDNEHEIFRTADSLDVGIVLRRDPDNLAELMYDVDFSVNTLGTTVYELFTARTPMIGIPDNPTPIADVLTDRGLAIVLNRNPSANDIRQAIRRMVHESRVRRGLVDSYDGLGIGDGPARVVDLIEDELS